ncbi:hypothetical protein [uncultured Sphingomonas sp.]|uniref:hypothetical protein n=1 Tax=uncultured Sphingomonas sp. TaxID=158754 RepID=UPI0025DC61BA|nr:hypothetical protein [uncultured Sphingomonas sp.]
MKARPWAVLLLALVLGGCREEAAPARSAPSRDLALLTSLPLALGEGFTLDAPSHPLMDELERVFSVRLVDGPEQLRAGGLLLAVQPQALTAERLVALDRWVRRGGRLLLLADPRFVWESSRPLGDKARPPFAYQDTGLLGHWGLTLARGEDGPVLRQLGGMEVVTGSPGSLEAAEGSRCEVESAGLVARCAIGRGMAVVVADADLVQMGVPGGLDGPTEGNYQAVAVELGRLAAR